MPWPRMPRATPRAGACRDNRDRRRLREGATFWRANELHRIARAARTLRIHLDRSEDLRTLLEDIHPLTDAISVMGGNIEAAATRSPTWEDGWARGSS